MRTRNEQVQAHRFVTRRIVSALLIGDPETTDQPMRRLGMAIIGSVMVATIALAGIGVYGLLFPGGGKPAAGSIVIERESGSLFVYLNGQLHPVLNIASARLVIGSASPTITTAAASSLRDLPRGVTVGISGAPSELPDKKALVGLPWQACDGPSSTGSLERASSVVAGTVLPGGSDLGDDGILVSSSGTTYLVWHAHRLAVSGNSVLAALNLTTSQPVKVDDVLINAIPPGPNLQKPTISGAGGKSSKSAGGAQLTIGRVYQVGQTFYVALKDGLAPISKVTAQLLSSNATSIQTLTADAIGTASSGTTHFDPDNWPPTVPNIRSVESTTVTTCVSYQRGTDDINQRVGVSTYDQLPDLLSANTEGAASAVHINSIDGVQTASRVILAGGHGALVRDLPHPGVNATISTYLVTDQGVKYPLGAATQSSGTAPSSGNQASAQDSLGYAGVTPTPIDSSLLALIPTGPELDSADAGAFPKDATPSATPGPSKPPVGTGG
jgi:type VII secretion protein EccB